jgi:hypothetical protein
MALSWLRSRIALVTLMLCTCVACTTGTLAQAPPAPEPAIPTSPEPDSLAALSFKLLTDILARTERIATFRFDKPCFQCRVRNLTVKDVVGSITPVPLDPNHVASIRKLLAREDSFILSLAKSCPPLFATEGLILYQSGTAAIFLIYPNCQVARLILETETAPYLFNIDPIYSQLTSLQVRRE